MNTFLESVDYAAISPLLILLAGALVLLLVETFSAKNATKYSFYLSTLFLIATLLAAIFAPISNNPLLTPWLIFDSSARFFAILFISIGIIITFLTDSFFQRFPVSQGEYYFLLFSSLFGLLLIGYSADFLTLFLGLETLSIALYVLCGYVKKWETTGEAAMKYFIMGSVAAAFFLYGAALIYGAVGNTQLNGLLNAYHSLAVDAHQTLFFAGIAFITLGLAFKAAIVPFHIWAPDVYDGAPNPVTAFMAVGTKAGAFAAFARVFLVALPNFDPLWNRGMVWLAILTMIYANFLALRQTQLRRFFAFSGISHAGFLLIPIIANTSESIPALEFYLVVYSLATLGAFSVLAILDHHSKGVFLKDLQGLFTHSPWLAGILTLSLLTLAGIPPTAGFFAKFYVFKLAFQTGDYALIIVGLLTTILSAFYYLRIISLIFSEPSTEKIPSQIWPAAIVGIGTFAAILVFSIFPDALFGLLSK